MIIITVLKIWKMNEIFLFTVNKKHIFSLKSNNWQRLCWVWISLQGSNIGGLKFFVYYWCGMLFNVLWVSDRNHGKKYPIIE